MPPMEVWQIAVLIGLLACLLGFVLIGIPYLSRRALRQMGKPYVATSKQLHKALLESQKYINDHSPDAQMKALAANQQMLAIIRETDNRAGETAAMTMVAANLLRLRRYEEALPFYAEAIAKLRGSGADAAEIVPLLMNSAKAYKGIGQTERAIEILREVLHFYKLRPNPDKEAKVWIRLGDGAKALGRIPEAIEALSEALRITESHGDSLKTSAVTNSLAALAIGRGDLATGENLVQRALELAGSNDSAERLLALTNQSVLYIHSGRLSAAEGIYQERIAISRRLQDPKSEAKALCGLATLKRRLGEIDQGRSLMLEANTIAAQYPNSSLQLAVLIDSAEYEHSVGYTQHAMALLKNAEQMNITDTTDGMKTVLETNMAFMRGYMGHLSECNLILNRHLVITEQRQWKHMTHSMLLGIAWIHLCRHEFASAKQKLDPALASTRESGFRLNQAEALVLLAECFLGMRDLESADQTALEAAKLAQMCGIITVLTRALAIRVETALARSQGDAVSLANELREAVLRSRTVHSEAAALRVLALVAAAEK